MRPILIAGGLIVCCISLLVCWPLVQLVATHRMVPGQVLQVLPEPTDDGQQRLHLRYRFDADPHHGCIGERQADRFFRTIPPPVVGVERAREIQARLMPDQTGSSEAVHVWFRVNDPVGTAFIVDISAAHPMRRYVFGLLLATAGLATAWLAWRRGRWEPAT